MRGLCTDRTAQVIIAGLAFLQNVRRGHYELATETRRSLRVATALAELAHANLTPRSVRMGLPTDRATHQRLQVLRVATAVTELRHAIRFRPGCRPPHAGQIC